MQLYLHQIVTDAGEPTAENEDRCGMSDRAAWMLDGATNLGPLGLMGLRSASAWWAMRVSDLLSRSTSDARSPIKMSEILHEVTIALRKAYISERQRAPEGTWERPSGSFLIIACNNGRGEIAWVGDCVCLMIREGIVRRLGPAASMGEMEAAKMAHAANPDYLGAPIEASLMGNLRAARGALTRAALDVETVAEARYHSMKFDVMPEDQFILMSDGYAALCDKYGMSEAQMISCIGDIGLHGTLGKLREIEIGDPKGQEHPRFKKSDDATALWLRASNF